jgi:hypothetical protein
MSEKVGKPKVRKPGEKSCFRSQEFRATIEEEEREVGRRTERYMRQDMAESSRVPPVPNPAPRSMVDMEHAPYGGNGA